MHTSFTKYFGVAVLALALCGGRAVAQTIGPDADQLAKTRAKGVDYLKTTQTAGGYWTTDNVGISSLVTYSLLVSGVPESDPVLAKALKYITSNIRPDGSITGPKGGQVNYETSLCVMVLQAANKDGKYTEAIKNAEKFLRELQLDEGESLKSSDVNYGGAGYGKNTNGRPDLSNTAFFLEALKAAGAKQNDPALQKAMAFVSRCQNLETEHNATPFAALVNDGGFYYTPSGEGSSPAGKEPNGGLRSYGAMTYNGLKSMVYAGLKADDPRVKAAVAWITKYYTVEENPGMGQQGVLYYYQAFAKALSAMDLDLVKDAEGASHDWRKELAEHLMKKQQPNGSWVNKTDRWYEGNPDLGTAFVLVSLHYCEPKPAKAK